MKLLPVLTASAIGGMVAAASISPAFATAAEPIFQVRSTVGIKSAPITAPEISGEVEQGSPDEAEVVDSGTPAPEVQPEQETTEAEVPVEPEVAVSETAGAQAGQTPIIEPIEVLSALPTEESLAEAAEASPQESVTQAAAPLHQPPDGQSVLPSGQQSPTAVMLPSAEEALPEAGSSFTNGSELGNEASLAEAEVAQATDAGDQDAPREPRPIATLDPAKINEENRSSEGTPENSSSGETTTDSEPTKDAASEQAKDREVESAENPAEKPLPQTGSPAAALAIGGALLLIVGITLATWHRPNNS